MVKFIGNHLREVEDIILARAKRTEASLVVREKRAGFREES